MYHTVGIPLNESITYLDPNKIYLGRSGSGTTAPLEDD